MSDTATQKKTKQESKASDKQSLILWNDDVNDIDDIIDAIMDICSYDVIQAEQCATIAHYKGKCALVCNEPFNKLYMMKRQFDRCQINTTIE